jgi:hypothetical protein
MGCMDKRHFGKWIFFCLVSLICLLVFGWRIETAQAQEEVSAYLVPYTSSYLSMAVATPGVVDAGLTVIHITSLSDSICTATVIWRNELGSELCRTRSQRLNPGGTENHCSRPVLPVSGRPLCAQTCTPAPGPVPDHEGSAIVQVASQCENRVGVDARLFTTVVTDPVPPNELILGTDRIGVEKINQGLLE